MPDVGRPHAEPIKFRFNKLNSGLKRALQTWSHADRHSRTTKLIVARQDVVTKSCRVNTALNCRNVRLQSGMRTKADVRRRR
jgi:hypothetical protein